MNVMCTECGKYVPEHFRVHICAPRRKPVNPLQKRKQLNLWQPTPSNDRNWSPQQTAVFDWFNAGAGNLIVRARAGTGKTTTIIEGIARANEKSILLAAFNTK